MSYYVSGPTDGPWRNLVTGRRQLVAVLRGASPRPPGPGQRRRYAPPWRGLFADRVRLPATLLPTTVSLAPSHARESAAPGPWAASAPGLPRG